MKMKLTLVMRTMRLFFCLLWIVLGIMGVIYGVRGIRWLDHSFSQSIDGLRVNIDVVADLLDEMVVGLNLVDQSLSTVERSTLEASNAMEETTPIIDKTSQIVVKDVPNVLEDVQASMPSVIQAAAAVDQTLQLLDRFQVTIPIPFGKDIQLGLGIDYDPYVPLDQALANLSETLEPIPASMRAIEGDLNLADTNILIVSNNLVEMASDLSDIRKQVAGFSPELLQLTETLTTINANLDAAQKQMPERFQIVEYIWIILMVLLILGQIPIAALTIIEFVETEPVEAPNLKGAKDDTQ